MKAASDMDLDHPLAEEKADDERPALTPSEELSRKDIESAEDLAEDLSAASTTCTTTSRSRSSARSSSSAAPASGLRDDGAATDARLTGGRPRRSKIIDRVADEDDDLVFTEVKKKLVVDVRDKDDLELYYKTIPDYFEQDDGRKLTEVPDRTSADMIEGTY